MMGETCCGEYVAGRRCPACPDRKTKPPSTGIDEVREALFNLIEYVEHHRTCYETIGHSHTSTGRAWDMVRRAIRRGRAALDRNPVPDEVRELRELSEKAGKAPWAVEGSIYEGMAAAITSYGSDRTVAHVWEYPDACFATASVNYVRNHVLTRVGDRGDAGRCPADGAEPPAAPSCQHGIRHVPPCALLETPVTQVRCTCGTVEGE